MRWLGKLLLTILCGETPVVAWAAPAVEKWSDPQLTVQEGLVAWLDASRQGEAAEGAGKPAPRDGGALETWFDGSGNALHMSAPAESARPRFLRAGEGADTRAVVRFDGEGTFVQHILRARGGLSFGGMSIFIVAAPLSNTGDFRGLLALSEKGKNDYTSGLNIDQGPGGSARPSGRGS